MIVDLPFPPPALSPNARLHWAQVSKVKKKYRGDAWALTKFAAANWQMGGYVAEGGQRLDFTFYPPQNRDYDRDNLIARMKAGIDGISDALGINDKHFQIGNIDIAPKVPGGSVRVQITPITGDTHA